MKNSNTNNEEYFRNWAGSYYESAHNLTEKIKKKKEEMKKCKDKDKIPILRNDICILKESYYDCMETARILLAKANREKYKMIQNKNG